MNDIVVIYKWYIPSPLRKHKAICFRQLKSISLPQNVKPSSKKKLTRRNPDYILYTAYARCGPLFLLTHTLFLPHIHTKRIPLFILFILDIKNKPLSYIPSPITDNRHTHKKKKGKGKWSLFNEKVSNYSSRNGTAENR